MAIFLSFLVALLLIAPSWADVATFQQNVSGYTGVKDVTIRNGSANQENSGELNMKSSVPDGSATTRGSLISFDLSSLSAANTVTAVKIDLVSTAAGNNTATVNLFKLLRTDWVAAEATYVIYKTANNWTTAGARGNGTDIDGSWSDGSSGVLSSFSVGAADVTGTGKTWATSSAFVAVVQSALGGTLHLAGTETLEANGNCSMNDSSVATAGNRPLLTITYTPAGGAVAANVPVTPGVVTRSMIFRSGVVR